MSSSAAGVAAALAAGALLLALPGRPVVERRRPLPSLSSASPVLLVAPVAGAAVWLDLRGCLLLGVGAALLGGVVHLGRRRRTTAEATRRADQVLAACDALAGELAAGLPPITALDRAAEEWAELAPVAVAGRMGADVPAALLRVSTRPGAGHLRRVAATWQVALESGAGLASGLRASSAAIRAEHRTARVVAAELSAANATARMLGVLPFAILLLGMGVGGDPVHFLLGTTGGAVVLALGVGLSLTGVLWLERIADRVLHR